MRVLFDATVFAEGLRKTSGRSGIFWAAFEIFKELSLRSTFELGVYASRSAIDPVNIFLHENFPTRNFRVLNGRRSSLIGRLWWWASGLSGGVLLNTARTMIKIVRILDDKYHHCKGVAKLADGFDIFFSPVYLAPYSIRKYSKVRRVTYIHDTIPKLFPQYSLFTRLGFSWNFDLINGLLESDWCCANSECTKRDFLRFSKRLRSDHVQVVPLAASEKFHPVTDMQEINRVRVKYGIPNDRRYFLSLCNIAPHKNLQFAICAFRSFAKTHADCVFVLAGAKYSLYSFAEAGDGILQIGYVDDEDLAALYSGAVAFVYLSLYEGFGLPPLEAMQCGTPVITSNISSMPEVVANAAITVDPTDNESAVVALTRIFEDEATRSRYSELGIKRARHFSWQQTAELLVSTFVKAAL